MFSLREGLNLEMRSSKLEEEWQDEIMEKSLGEIVWWVWWMCAWMLEREVHGCQFRTLLFMGSYIILRLRFPRKSIATIISIYMSYSVLSYNAAYYI